MNGEDVRDHKAENTPDNTVWCITIIHRFVPISDTMTLLGCLAASNLN